MLDPRGPIEIHLTTLIVAVNNEFKTSKTVKSGSIYVYNAPRFPKKTLLLEGTQALPICLWK